MNTTMDPKTKTSGKQQTSKQDNTSRGEFFGRLFAFNTSIKLYHWHVTGKGSYAQHIAIDQALVTLSEVMDRIVETSYSVYGTIDITVPECNVPGDIVDYCQEFFDYVDDQRELFSEDFIDSIIDDCHEAVQQLLYRLKRLQ